MELKDMTPRHRALTLAALLVAALGASSPALAAQASVEDFLGSWEVELTMGGNAVTSVITFTRAEDGTLAGTWEGPRGGAMELGDVRFVDGKLTFTRSFGGGRPGGGAGRQGGAGDGQGGGGGRGPGAGGRGGGGGMTVETTIQDGKLHGTMTTPRGEIEFEGTRRDS